MTEKQFKIVTKGGEMYELDRFDRREHTIMFNLNENSEWVEIPYANIDRIIHNY